MVGLISLLRLTQGAPKFLTLLLAHSGWPHLLCFICTGWQMGGKGGVPCGFLVLWTVIEAILEDFFRITSAM